MPYSSSKYEFLFDRSEEITENAFERLKHSNVFRYRARTIKAGDILEVEIFPFGTRKTSFGKQRRPPHGKHSGI